MATPRILFIAPSSYPISDAEANVNAKALKMLTDRGCVIDLVCRKYKREYYPDSHDDLFFGKVNSIHEVFTDTEWNIPTIWRHLRCLTATGYVYKASDWTVSALKVCEWLIAQNKYDFIYTYNRPSELVGYILSERHGIKWVAVWNDPYVPDKLPAPYGKGSGYKLKNPLRRKLIARIGQTAYRHLFPSERLRDYMLSYMTDMTKEKTCIAPHIVGRSLSGPVDKPLGNVLKIIHSGSLNIVRNPDTFCAGLRMFIDRNPGANIEFTFLGVFEREKDYFSALIAQYDLESHIRRLPPVSYTESIEALDQYDACLLIEAKLDEGIFLPSKIADYIQADKPIIALSPAEGVAHDLHIDGQIEYFADVTSPQQVASVIGQVYGDFLAGKLKRRDKSVSFFSEDSVYQIHERIFNSAVEHQVT